MKIDNRDLRLKFSVAIDDRSRASIDRPRREFLLLRMDADRDSGTPTVWRFLARKLHYGRGTDADRAQLHAISVCTFIFLFHFAICDLQLTIFF